MSLESLAVLIKRDIRPPECAVPREPVFQPVDARLPETGTQPAAFEAKAFNFLLAKKHSLGIARLLRCKNARIDGLIELEDGCRVGLEIKYRMNWEKACQACAQMAFYQRHFAGDQKLDSGLVVFERFSADWARKKTAGSPVEIGWSHWYLEHHDAEGLRMDLARIQDDNFESLPSSLAA